MNPAQERENFKPPLPPSLIEIRNIEAIPSKETLSSLDPSGVLQHFPLTGKQPLLHFEKAGQQPVRPLTLGIVLSGGPAPGGHTVIAGIFDAVTEIHQDSKVLGFLSGPQGLIDGRYELLSGDKVNQFRHTGGFDLLGSGRTKIEKPEQFERVKQVAQSLSLDGIVIIGGDDSNTNAAVLAEYFQKEGVSTCVIGVPKTIDGDLCNEYVEISFGFDTATKVYSQLISNLTKDAKSAEKYYHFVKIMGRSASHVALECALQVHPNYTLISEEIQESKVSLQSIISDICNIIEARAKEGRNYGVVLLPEGLIEAIDEIACLIKEINEKNPSPKEFSPSLLSTEGQQLFFSFPAEIQKRLLLEKDPHGNIQVSLIPTEKLIVHLVSQELEKRKSQGAYKGKFQPVEHFFGYEGRCSFPSNFDVTYCYSLGRAAAFLAFQKKTGYMVGIQHLTSDVSLWEVFGVPIVSLINMEKRHDVMKPVIKKYLVNLQGIAFNHFAKSRDLWAIKDDYQQVMPMQFFGPSSITDSRPQLLSLNKKD